MRQGLQSVPHTGRVRLETLPITLHSLHTGGGRDHGTRKGMEEDNMRRKNHIIKCHFRAATALDPLLQLRGKQH